MFLLVSFYIWKAFPSLNFSEVMLKMQWRGLLPSPLEIGACDFPAKTQLFVPLPIKALLLCSCQNIPSLLPYLRNWRKLVLLKILPSPGPSCCSLNVSYQPLVPFRGLFCRRCMSWPSLKLALRCSVMQQNLQCVFVQISSMLFIADITWREKHLLRQSGNRMSIWVIAFPFIQQQAEVQEDSSDDEEDDDEVFGFISCLNLTERKVGIAQ